MINWIKDILKISSDTEIIEWRTQDSIHNFLSSNIDTDGKLNEKANDLPDEVRDDNEIKFAPGLMDAMFGADNSDDSKKRTQELYKHLKRVAKNGDKISEQEFYKLVTEDEGVISIIDNFLQLASDDGLPVEPYLFQFSKDLATKAPKRNAVKFGIALLGLGHNKSVLNDLQILGLHDEFTVYATIAIANLAEDPAIALWELAQKVDGWGKIQLVDRLANMELNEQIKEWLVFEGYKNNIMYEYLAYTCATHGLLHERLESEKIEKKLFKAAEDIIDALIAGGPAEDISCYEHAASLVENFLLHAKDHANDIGDFLTIHRIKDFLIELQNDIGTHADNGWTQDIISNCIIDAVQIINSRDWAQLTTEGLKSSDNITYWNAKQAAAKLSIDLWDTVWRRLVENPADSSAWFDVTHYAKPDKAEQIIDFALNNIPLEEYATGPKDSYGIGPDHGKYMILDTAITFLENHPRQGEKVLLVGLKSPVTRNRNMVIKALKAWTKDNWSPEIEKELYKLRNIEPNKDTKANIERLINGQELE